MKQAYKTAPLTGLASLMSDDFSRGECVLPQDLDQFDFVGYDSSCATLDPRGVLRLQKRFPDIPDYSINFLNSFDDKPREVTISRAAFDAMLHQLERKVLESEGSLKEHIFSCYSVEESGLKLRTQYAEMLRIKEQVEKSLETPLVYRETIGRIVQPSTAVNGVEYTVDLAWTCTQISDAPCHYFLRGDEIVVRDSSRQIMANRYFNDPRVIVHGTFEGDVRRPQNFRSELDEPTKVKLTILFGQLYGNRGVEEISFPNGDKRAVVKEEKQ